MRTFRPFALLPLLLLAMAACQPQAVNRGPAVGAGAPATIALLVPSGSEDARQEALSESLVRAAELAVEDLGTDARVDLRVYPTAGDPVMAEEAARSAAADGAHIILGPLFSGATVAAGREAAKHGLTVLSFSNNTRVAGGNVFILGNTFENSADVLVSHAASTGLRRFSVIASQNEAGELATGAVTGAAVTNGAAVVSIATYERTASGVIDAVPGIRETIMASEAEAIVLDADAAGALPIFAEMLPEGGPDPETVKYIGLTRWDIPSATMRHAALQGGWFARPDPVVYGQFVNRYRGAHGSRPHPLAGLAYDGVKAIGALLRTGSRAPLSTQSLTRFGGFEGVNGVFRLRRDGTVERLLAVVEIREGRAEIINPADRDFGGAGT